MFFQCFTSIYSTIGRDTKKYFEGYVYHIIIKTQLQIHEILRFKKTS